ncbi:alpha-hydroxy acid oxidase [Nonomuraea sp. NEAU-A123]|uniref:alpha-hydroxy acid oxidase n=1 Tax=Nonomuraea sp. NEAU-A123 TaxID=2839649 RepID=UPI001BE41CBE|nr:alpha-hydroxy acid oxidase [Nonomuraea sp. NEAU-A123]MBT2232136.1 alpha-hydroxy-acid oxidizing protein [Nonomuraea sp. NEAU-A123]
MKFKDLRTLALVQAPARSVSERLERSCFSVEDVRRIAARRLPKGIFDYMEGGGEDEASLRRNQEAYSDWSFVPRWGSVANLDVSSSLLGGPASMPLYLAPTGGTRLFHPEGEIAVALAAQKAGLPFGLAGLSNTPMEAVSAAAPSLRRFFNFSLTTDKGLLQALVDRAASAGYEGLIINVDCRAIGHRERDYRNGFTAPPSIRGKTVIEGALHPRWTLRFLANDAIAFPNLSGEVSTGPLTSTPDMWRSLLAGSYEPTDWRDIEDLRERWRGPIIVKGCVSADDALVAAGIGIDAVQVSNHGGRQLDHMAAPLDVLPEIVDKAAGRVEIIVDGGIRRGTDVVKALALGADACAIGRPYLYGVAAAGQAGVEHVLNLFRAEITRTMMLLGVTSIKELRTRGRDLLRHRSDVLGLQARPTSTHI